MKYYSEETVKGLLEQLDSHFVKYLENLPSIEIKEPYGDWHTGTPTEEGDYLVKLDVEHHVYQYYVLKWANGWYSHYDMDNQACLQHRVLKWQKIEETD